MLGIRLLEGREFTGRDSVKAASVMIVKETFVKRFFEGRNPIGRKVRYDGFEIAVVGVVKDSKYHTPIEGPRAFFYVPFR